MSLKKGDVVARHGRTGIVEAVSAVGSSVVAIVNFDGKLVPIDGGKPAIIDSGQQQLTLGN